MDLRLLHHVLKNQNMPMLMNFFFKNLKGFSLFQWRVKILRLDINHGGGMYKFKWFCLFSVYVHNLFFSLKKSYCCCVLLFFPLIPIRYFEFMCWEHQNLCTAVQYYIYCSNCSSSFDMYWTCWKDYNLLKKVMFISKFVFEISNLFSIYAFCSMMVL